MNMDNKIVAVKLLKKARALGLASAVEIRSLEFDRYAKIVTAARTMAVA
jgi:hypothetical protein